MLRCNQGEQGLTNLTQKYVIREHVDDKTENNLGEPFTNTEYQSNIHQQVCQMAASGRIPVFGAVLLTVSRDYILISSWSTHTFSYCTLSPAFGSKRLKPVRCHMTDLRAIPLPSRCTQGFCFNTGGPDRKRAVWELSS